MDSKSEVMEQKPEQIREGIEETRSQLTEKLGELEEQLRGTVETAKSQVEETIESVKTSVRKLSPKHQVQEHPFLWLGAATVAGILAGRAASRSAPRGPFDGEMIGEPESLTAETSATSSYETANAQYRGRMASPPSAFSTLWNKFQETFSDEIELAKGMAIGAALNTFKDVAKRSLPSIAKQIDQVVGSAMSKFETDPDSSDGGPESKGSKTGWGHPSHGAVRA